MVSLAVNPRSLRQTFAGAKVSVRDAFYKGLYPLVPFLLVLIVIGIQLFPLGIANFLYGVVITGGLAVTAVEKLLWCVIILLLVIWSFYMVTSSVFALYVVTLPDVRPLQALRSARDLVFCRRWNVMRKFLFLPFALIIICVVIMFPVILFLTPLAQWVFLLLSMASLVVCHAYMYTLYRELLK